MAKQAKADAALRQAVEALEDIVRQGVPHPDQHAVMANFQACAERRGVAKATLDEAIRRLAAFAEPLTLVPATFPVFACGLCIENGGDAEPAVSVTLRFAKQSVRHAAQFHTAMKAVPPGGGLEIPDDDWVAGNMYELLSPVLFHVLKRSTGARQAVRADPEFMRDACVFEDVGECPEGWVVRELRRPEPD